MAKTTALPWQIANNPNLYNPQIQRNFDLVIYGLDELTNPLTGTKFDNGKESITISVQQATLPSETTGVLELDYANTQFKISNGKTTFDTLKITVNDYIGANAYGMFRALKNRNSDAKSGVAGDVGSGDLSDDGYMFTSYLIARKPSGEISRIYKFTNCFVVSVGQKQFDRKSNEVQSFDVEIAFSLMTEEPID